jgi:hypothetical protein
VLDYLIAINVDLNNFNQTDIFLCTSAASVLDLLTRVSFWRVREDDPHWPLLQVAVVSPPLGTPKENEMQL